MSEVRDASTRPRACGGGGERERNVREDEGRARWAALRAGRVGCRARRSTVWIGRGRGGAGVSLMELRGAGDPELRVSVLSVRTRWRWRDSLRVGKEDDAR
jgi:hypothetical protein